MTTTGPVTIVVVTYNSGEVIGDFLAALPPAVQGLDFQLVVVDNASDDETTSIVERLVPSALLIRSPDNLGYADGINLGVIKSSPTGHVLVLNPDIRLHAGALAAMLTAAEQPKVGIVVPQLRDDHGRLLHSLRRDPNPVRVLGEAVLGGTRAGRHNMLGEIVMDPAQYQQAGPIDWATGACMLLTPECLSLVGDWDGSFFLYSEETDYALRTRDAGLVVYYEPAARATHLGGEVHQSPELFRLLTVNRLRLYRRRHGALSGLAFRAALVAGTVPRALAGRRTSRSALAGLLSPLAETKPATTR